MKPSLEFHKNPSGKIGTALIKSCSTPEELSLAYSPGVADPCMEIYKDKNTAYDYTNKGNLVAVISNGTAVLGLGNIGPLASKPVMEGKAFLFKQFGKLNSFDLELNAPTSKEMIQIIRALEPSFGGINLEDIKAPECFEIEENLQSLSIPVFHDDQHGTAITISAGLLNALELSNRTLQNIKIIVLGAGSGALATSKLLLALGVLKEQLFIFDTKGLLHKNRTDLNKYKQEFTQEENISFKDCLNGADVFIGCSSANALSQEHIRFMKKDPIIFALSNPIPEIFPEEVYEIHPNAFVATGRSDYPNQINNLLTFPYIFRAALDTRSPSITLEMKKAAVYALASLAKEPVTQDLRILYPQESFIFGKEYFIPKAFDKRLLYTLPPAIALAAKPVVQKQVVLDEYITFLKNL